MNIFVDVSSRHGASSQVALRCACRKVALPCVEFPNVSPSKRILCVAFPKRLRHHNAFFASCFKPSCQSRSSRCVSKHCVVKSAFLALCSQPIAFLALRPQRLRHSMTRAPLRCVEFWRFQSTSAFGAFPTVFFAVRSQTFAFRVPVVASRRAKFCRAFAFEHC